LSKLRSSLNLESPAPYADSMLVQITYKYCLGGCPKLPLLGLTWLEEGWYPLELLNHDTLQLDSGRICILQSAVLHLLLPEIQTGLPGTFGLRRNKETSWL